MILPKYTPGSSSLHSYRVWRQKSIQKPFGIRYFCAFVSLMNSSLKIYLFKCYMDQVHIAYTIPGARRNVLRSTILLATHSLWPTCNADRICHKLCTPKPSQKPPWNHEWLEFPNVYSSRPRHCRLNNSLPKTAFVNSFPTDNGISVTSLKH